MWITALKDRRKARETASGEGVKLHLQESRNKVFSKPYKRGTEMAIVSWNTNPLDAPRRGFPQKF
jgi:adenylate kinase